MFCCDSVEFIKVPVIIQAAFSAACS